MIRIGIEGSDCFIGVECIAACSDSIWLNRHRKLSVLPQGIPIEDSSLEGEGATVSRRLDARKCKGCSGTQWCGGGEDKVLSWDVKLGAGVRPAGDALAASDVGKSRLVNLKDDICRIGKGQAIAIEGDVGDFVDDSVGEGDARSLPGWRIDIVSVGRCAYGLGVDVDDRRRISRGVFQDGELKGGA